jgi:hypothetical protein
VFEQGLLKGWLRGFVEFGVSKQGELPDDPPPVAGLFGGYFYLNLSHMRLMGLREKTKANAATVINEVRLAIRELFDLEQPFIIAKDFKPLAEWPRHSRTGPAPAVAGDVLHGIGGIAGSYAGRVRVVNNLHQADARR